MKKVNKFASVTTTLTAAVADDGTFTVGYPTGTSQASFTTGLAGDGHYMIVDNNDKWSNADPGISVAFGASLITITNLTGAALASGSEILLMLDKVDAGPVHTLSFPIDLASIAGAGDVVTGFKPGVDGVVESVSWVQGTPVTTAGDGATLNLEINAVNVIGGAVVLTSAACTPLGVVIEGSEITGANAITRDDTLSVEAASVTAFAEGSGVLMVRIREVLPDAY